MGRQGAAVGPGRRYRSARHPALRPPRGPDDKRTKNRLHLDLRPDDQTAELARVEGLGARRVGIGQTGETGQTGQTGEETFVVLADPEGNEFCILRPGPLDVDLNEVTGS